MQITSPHNVLLESWAEFLWQLLCLWTLPPSGGKALNNLAGKNTGGCGQKIAAEGEEDQRSIFYMLVCVLVLLVKV